MNLGDNGDNNSLQQNTGVSQQQPYQTQPAMNFGNITLQTSEDQDKKDSNVNV